MTNENIRLLLIFTILIPIVIGVIHYKTADNDSRLFLFFLIIGFFTDLTMRLLNNVESHRHLVLIYNVYSLIEALFFFWYIRKKTESKLLRSFANAFLYTTLPFWIFCHTVYSLLLSEKISQSALFDITYEILAAFLAGFALLQLTERSDGITRTPVFWFTMGIFFYCFCTFFIMGYLQTWMAIKIWFMNNIINLISYSFFTMGFWQLRHEKKAVP